jgi:hypothetical protein
MEKLDPIAGLIVQKRDARATMVRQRKKAKTKKALKQWDNWIKLNDAEVEALENAAGQIAALAAVKRIAQQYK